MSLHKDKQQDLKSLTEHKRSCMNGELVYEKLFLAIGEMQVKFTKKWYYMPIRIASDRKTNSIQSWEVCAGTGTFPCGWWGVERTTALENNMEAYIENTLTLWLGNRTPKCLSNANENIGS